MNSTLTQPVSDTLNFQSAVDEALKRIPPLWPLEHFVAVNPFLGLAGKPFAEACATLRRTIGHAPVQPADFYLSAWKSGSITSADLAPFTDLEWTEAKLVKTLQLKVSDPLFPPVCSFADLLDDTIPHAHWSRFIAEEISKWCSVHFDRNQTTWESPWKLLGLFEAWKSAAVHDRKPEVFGLPGFRQFISQLPDDPSGVIEYCLGKLQPAGVSTVDFLHRQLANISGWAGHVQYLVREDALRGRESHALRDLLAIRLAYDAALHSAFGAEAQVSVAWRHQHVTTATSDRDEALARWQAAYESVYQRKLISGIIAQASKVEATRPPVQAVFCIDVRSEIVRRHLEAALPGTHTLGFAGFFGFPVSHTAASADKPKARCPVLLAPPIESAEEPPENASQLRAWKGAWKAFQNSAASCFTFVESLGIAIGAKLVRSHDKHQGCSAHKPSLVGLAPEEKAKLAEGALRGMSLTRNFARLVLVCGHGSHSENNPYASALECGACGGHSGDVNARLAADTLNDPQIRSILADKGIHIPDDTVFIAGCHDTLSDDFQLFDKEDVPSSHQDELAALVAALAQAGEAARIERAPKLGLSHLKGVELDKAIRNRGTDIAQVRPEWALANNAAFVAAPRPRTAGLKLDGRVFLHEYDPASDPNSEILTAILTAPVVVASWINLQYYASRIDPQRFAAGDKTIHQVVGGIGVIEGNAGDLKTGLPLQSIHNGEEFIHEPRRLTVIIQSQPQQIEAVLKDHPEVCQLFDNQWLHLFALSDEGSALRRMPGGNWEPLLID
jgi:uncharacterized protein YbcC (UPF0753/DUF2309 family)